MRKSVVFPTLALSAALLSGALTLPSIADSSRDSREAKAASGAAWLPLGEIVRRLEAAGYRNIEKIEREHGTYEARATDRNGVRVKLDIHPQTGKITPRSDERHERRDGAQARARGAEGQAQAQCTKRRCRDDLPTEPAAAASPQSAR